MRVKKQRRDTSHGTCPKSVNPPLGVGSSELPGLKRTDLVECGWEGKGVFLDGLGGSFFTSSHHIEFVELKLLCKGSPPTPPRPGDPRSSSLSHFCHHSPAHLFLPPFHGWEN